MRFRDLDGTPNHHPPPCRHRRPIHAAVAHRRAARRSACSHPDPVVGRWKTETLNAIVEVTRCGASICGRVLSSDALRANPALRDSRNADASLRTRPVLGMLMLSGFKPDGVPNVTGVWSGGQVYNADDGHTYSGRITPVGADRLKLRGCVFFPLCKTQTWTRVR